MQMVIRLITLMEGMSFETPKGTMTFRPEDHQALQTMYSISLEKQDGVDYPVPVSNSRTVTRRNRTTNFKLNK